MASEVNYRKYLSNDINLTQIPSEKQRKMEKLLNLFYKSL